MDSDADSYEAPEVDALRVDGFKRVPMPRTLNSLVEGGYLREDVTTVCVIMAGVGLIYEYKKNEITDLHEFYKDLDSLVVEYKEKNGIQRASLSFEFRDRNGRRLNKYVPPMTAMMNPDDIAEALLFLDELKEVRVS